jgi:ABC-2 type transport system permease protein
MVRRVLRLFWRDFLAYFYSPAAYVTIFGFLFLNGLVMNFELGRSNGDVDVAIRYLFGNFFFWLLMLTVPPLVTMRLLAEERRSGTIELLMTAPVRTGEVIAGKYAAGLAFTTFVWSLLLVDLGVVGLRLHRLTISLDWGTVAAFYVGILGLEAFFVGAGLLASALSRNQVVAAVLGLGINLLVFFVGVYHSLFGGDEYEALIFSYLSVISHFVRDFAAGVVDFRYLALYLVYTAASLVLATWALEARKWR